MLCVITYIREDVFKNAQNNHHIQKILLSRVCLLDQLKKSHMKLLIRSGANIKISIIRMIILTVMDLYRTVNILVMVTVIHGIKNNPYHPPKFLFL